LCLSFKSIAFVSTEKKPAELLVKQWNKKAELLVGQWNKKAELLVGQWNKKERRKSRASVSNADTVSNQLSSIFTKFTSKLKLMLFV